MLLFDTKLVGETKCLTTKARDDSFILSNLLPQDSSPFLYKDNRLPVEGSKHHTEAAIGDGLGDRYGGQEIM
jgi:hypothetical protein